MKLFAQLALEGIGNRSRQRRFGISLIIGLLACTAISSFSQAPELDASQPPSTGQVIYSRSTDENGQTTTTNGPAAQTAGQASSDPVATDEDREAVTFTRFDMDVHLRPAEQSIAVRALLSVRNDGKSPLTHIPLQISSSLMWDRLRLNGRDVAFQTSTLNSDADHTGQLHEAAITLAAPLAPGSTAELDVSYSGKIAQNAQRLLAIGTPDDVALHSDWDAIGTDFTGLRGFGNVVWYPAASVPVILGDGARLFDEIGEHKLRMSGAEFRLRLAIEFPTGQVPAIALINGRPAALITTEGTEEVAGVATAEVANSTLNFEAPSLFVAIRKPEPGTNTTVWTRPEDESSVDTWTQATASVTPFLEGWLGKSPRSQLTILDLPDPEDAPFETGPLLATPIHSQAADVLNGILAHALTHAFLATKTNSPPAWISEGVAHFMGTLWVERTSGRDKALELLEAQRQALALAEPASPGTNPGQPLAAAISPVYYRTKANYVLWMLRDLAGDTALSAALLGYDPAIDASKGSSDFERLVKQASQRKDLNWFFSDWIENDKGLPDLSISKVFPEPAQAGNTLVGVTVDNAGYTEAEVPVTVSTKDTVVKQRVLVPARGSISARILILGTPTKVQVNDGTVPEVQASVHVTTLGDTTPEGSSSSIQSSAPQ